MSFERDRNDWDRLAHLDPFWAILTADDRRFGGWDLESFFATGEDEVEQLMASCSSLGLPVRRQRALEFGCGVGRLTRPLARFFAQCYGVDISPRMIEIAHMLNGSHERCRFLQNESEHLDAFPADDFDFVYTINVLQHLSSRAEIELSISELLRVLRPEGLLVFQLPVRVPLRDRVRLAISRASYNFLTGAGFSSKVVYQRFKTTPIKMTPMKERQVVSYLEALGAKIVLIQSRQEIGLPQSRAYFVTKQ